MKKILIGLLLVVVLAAAGIAVWQWDNINALRQGATVDPVELQEKMEEEEQHFQDVMEEYDLPREELPPEVLEKLISGELTPQEAAQQLLQKTGTESGGEDPSAQAVPGSTETTVQSAGQTGQPSAQSPTQPGQPANPGQSDAPAQSAGSSPQNKIQEDIETMYLLRATFEGKLNNVIQEAVAEYASGEADSAKKKEIVLGKLDSLSQMEADCDSQVSAILSDLREQLKAAGQDPSLADEMAQAYENTKDMKKAQLIQQFRGK